MNRGLLIWNIVLTILLLGMIVSGCTSMDPQFAYLERRVTSNTAAIEQLASAINENRKLIGEQATSLQALKLYVQTVLK